MENRTANLPPVANAGSALMERVAVKSSVPKLQKFRRISKNRCLLDNLADSDHQNQLDCPVMHFLASSFSGNFESRCNSLTREFEILRTFHLSFPLEHYPNAYISFREETTQLLNNSQFDGIQPQIYS